MKYFSENAKQYDNYFSLIFCGRQRTITICQHVEALPFGSLLRPMTCRHEVEPERQCLRACIEQLGLVSEYCGSYEMVRSVRKNLEKNKRRCEKKTRLSQAYIGTVWTDLHDNADSEFTSLATMKGDPVSNARRVGPSHRLILG